MESIIKSPSNLHDSVNSHQRLDWEGHWQLLNWVPGVGRGPERVLERNSRQVPPQHTPPTLTVTALQGWGTRERGQEEGTRLSFASCLFGGSQRRPRLASHRKDMWGLTPEHILTFLWGISSSVSSGKSQISRNVISLKIVHTQRLILPHKF